MTIKTDHLTWHQWEALGALAVREMYIGHARSASALTMHDVKSLDLLGLAEVVLATDGRRALARLTAKGRAALAARAAEGVHAQS